MHFYLVGHFKLIEVVLIHYICSWSKSKNHLVTDELLMLIKSKTHWKVALGFDKGAFPDAESQNSQGKTLLEHCADIAAALFIKDKPDTKWTHDDIKDLRVVVKNWVMR